MENLNAEKIKVALKCHCDPKNKCEICPYNKECCSMALSNDALALITSQEQRIKELTEQNERLRAIPEQLHKEMSERMTEERKIERKLAVRKFVERLKAETITIQDHTGKLGSVILVSTIDQIAREMLEG